MSAEYRTYLRKIKEASKSGMKRVRERNVENEIEENNMGSYLRPDKLLIGLQNIEEYFEERSNISWLAFQN